MSVAPQVSPCYGREHGRRSHFHPLRRRRYADSARAAIGSLDLSLTGTDLGDAASGYFQTHETGRPWRPIPKAQSTLQELASRGYVLGLVSNFDSSLRDILQSHGMIDLFSTVVISDEVGVEKPDPSIIGIACARLGVEPASSAYVGDHPYDVVCSKRAGVKSVWVKPACESMPAGVSEVPDWRVAEIAETLNLFSGPTV